MEYYLGALALYYVAFGVLIRLEWKPLAWVWRSYPGEDDGHHRTIVFLASPLLMPLGVVAALFLTGALALNYLTLVSDWFGRKVLGGGRTCEQ